MPIEPLSIPSIASGSDQPARRLPTAAGADFAAAYSEAIQEANQELAQIVSADSGDTENVGAVDDPVSFLELRAATSALAGGAAWKEASGELPGVHEELLQHLAAIRLGPGQAGASGCSELDITGDYGGSNSASVQPSGGGLSSHVRRLISWLDVHAHHHSTHHCATSVRKAMEAAGIHTVDRPASGDAGDYGPFLLRHGARVIAQESYEPKAGDIAVFDRTAEHPAGHIQVFDGHHWVSDYVQKTFSPYRDPGRTPPVTLYRLS